MVTCSIRKLVKNIDICFTIKTDRSIAIVNDIRSMSFINSFKSVQQEPITYARYSVLSTKVRTYRRTLFPSKVVHTKGHFPNGTFPATLSLPNGSRFISLRSTHVEPVLLIYHQSHHCEVSTIFLYTISACFLSKIILLQWHEIHHVFADA